MRSLIWRGRRTATVGYALLVILMSRSGLMNTVRSAGPARSVVEAAAVQPAAAHAMAAGDRAFKQGDIEQAATQWQEAARLSVASRQQQAQGEALVRLASAYEALGHYSQAIQSLHEAQRLAEAADNHGQTALILGKLGHMALVLGNVVEAERLLRDALARARTVENASLMASLLHTQGNLLLHQQQPQEALVVYQESARLAQKAQQFGTAARALTHAARAAEQQQHMQTAITLLADALTHLRLAEPSHDTAYDRLKIGRTYHRLAQHDPSLVLHATEVFYGVTTLVPHDQRALSYAWGYLGRLYEEAGRYQEALELTRRATLAAQQIHLPEALYLWQWQTGRLLRALQDFPPALAAYERAITTVQSIRPELLQRLRETTISFRTAIGPLYFERVDLLLQQAATLEAQPQEAAYPQYEWYLQQVRATVEQFKTIELRDYFGDECIAAAQPHITALERVSPEAIILYPILLADRTELLVSGPMGLKRIVRAVTGPDLVARVTIFRSALEDRDAFRYLQHAQWLYTWLIQPLESMLAAEHTRTLVVVPDGALRLLPFAALHDGQHFLIEKYALAVTPGLTLTEPLPLPQQTTRLLAAGMTGAVEDLPPLPRVAEELRTIQRLYGGIILLDQDFAPDRLETTLRQETFRVVHIAAHGRFASDAAQSFLLTTQGRLTMTHLAQMIGRLRFRDQPLELLTLSACQTAQDDDRAALGLAGIAIQAGARSALATLWLVADEATAVLMTTFYQQLKTAHVSKARALQQAQIALLKDPRYAEPVFWAPFLLINNWL